MLVMFKLDHTVHIQLVDSPNNVHVDASANSCALAHCTSSGLFAVVAIVADEVSIRLLSENGR